MVEQSETFLNNVVGSCITIFISQYCPTLSQGPRPDVKGITLAGNIGAAAGRFCTIKY